MAPRLDGDSSEIVNGFYVAPQVPGAGMTPNRKALKTIYKA
jgi:hypothetical protein